jgi:hypothetical protein
MLCIGRRSTGARLAVEGLRRAAVVAHQRLEVAMVRGSERKLAG